MSKGEGVGLGVLVPEGLEEEGSVSVEVEVTVGEGVLVEVGV